MRTALGERCHNVVSQIATVVFIALSITGSAYTRQSESTAPIKAAVTDTYRLGAGDKIAIAVPFADEINNKVVTIDTGGFINIPFAGHLLASGLTPVELESQLQKKLVPYFESPRVTVNVTEYGSRPVSVIGEVHRPAVHQLKGNTRLVELLSEAGGLTQEAGAMLDITRDIAYGKLPLPNAKLDPSGKCSTAEIELGPLLAGDPAQNIQLYPNDIVTVPRALLIYVFGEVRKPGGFPLRDAQSGSVLQALALAEGPLGTAGMTRARILRVQSAGPREELRVNLKKVLAREQPDIILKPNDILYIPNSKAKSAALRGVETAIQIGTGIVVWGRY